ncbi:MarR family [uncultured Roseburia sp.]|uniref:MarR family winged helix-turn-helix transcriptional regulator n=1 Tax=Brotonthovivens ammoniilytica TaxID=2981725 RepID=A0ABT2TJ69_9FIRM|nr:MarR family winged helix-turn-helix transcriptional regulator [Brotonthovivens ammoniilytica]MCU6762201.1 MarR family winged helix-turn-helix transcriptional regulator [Brotonthovivens ammoniilytica]SCI58625.1 MarR family [uncultured Roseburia sp.]
MNRMIREQIVKLNEAVGKTNALYGLWAKQKGLNYNSLMVLYSIDEVKDCTQKKISDLWLIPKQTVNSILNDLKEKGYVTVTPAKMNRKEKILAFTEAGETYAGALLEGLRNAEERAMRRLGAEACGRYVELSFAFMNAFKYEVEHE